MRVSHFVMILGMWIRPKFCIDVFASSRIVIVLVVGTRNQFQPKKIWQSSKQYILRQLYYRWPGIIRGQKYNKNWIKRMDHLKRAQHLHEILVIFKHSIIWTVLSIQINISFISISNFPIALKKPLCFRRNEQTRISKVILK